MSSAAVSILVTLVSRPVTGHTSINLNGISIILLSSIVLKTCVKHDQNIDWNLKFQQVVKMHQENKNYLLVCIVWKDQEKKKKVALRSSSPLSVELCFFVQLKYVIIPYLCWTTSGNRKSWYKGIGQIWPENNPRNLCGNGRKGAKSKIDMQS